jgi:AbrB family looped-hinge helix DNA binding protein
MQTKIDKFGRILIPQKIRRKLGLRAGEILQLEEFGKSIVIKANHSQTPDSDKLAIFEELLEFNKQFNLKVDPAIDISRLAEVG